MNVIYGIVISPKGDRYIDIAEKALEGMAKAAAPGAFLVDVFPWCECCSRARWYPIDYDATSETRSGLAAWGRIPKEGRKLEEVCAGNARRSLHSCAEGVG